MADQHWSAKEILIDWLLVRDCDGLCKLRKGKVVCQCTFENLLHCGRITDDCVAAVSLGGDTDLVPKEFRMSLFGDD